MGSFKEPGFQERVAAAARAKDKALAGLKAKPPVDEATVAERTARREAREKQAVEKREAARLAREAERRLREEEAAAKVALAAANQKHVPTEAERKAARDARYAARKSRK